MKEELEKIRTWADAKIRTGEEPPWAWYQYMKLIETADALLAGMGSVTTESSQQQEQQPDTHLRLADYTDLQDNAPHHPAGLPTRLPM
jgi:hypothetical protein